ncbi:regulator of sigma E protease, partial [Trypanosoma cruzi]
PMRGAQLAATHAQFLAPPRSLQSPTHKGGAMGEKEKSAAQHMHKCTRSSNAIHVALQERSMRTAHTQPQRKRDGAHPRTEHSPSLPSALTNWHGASQQVVAD